MRVFVAGASSAIGTRLIPQLIDRGHEVIGSCRSPRNADRVRALGAEPIVLDLLDAAAVHKAILETKPDAIVHVATGRAGILAACESAAYLATRARGVFTSA